MSPILAVTDEDYIDFLNALVASDYFVNTTENRQEVGTTHAFKIVDLLLVLFLCCTREHVLNSMVEGYRDELLERRSMLAVELLTKLQTRLFQAVKRYSLH